MTSIDLISPVCRGHGRISARDPERVADVVAASVSARWRNTRKVSRHYSSHRAMHWSQDFSCYTYCCRDPAVEARVDRARPGLSRLSLANADRDSVILSSLFEVAAFIEGHRPGTVTEGAVDSYSEKPEACIARQTADGGLLPNLCAVAGGLKSCVFCSVRGAHVGAYQPRDW